MFLLCNNNLSVSIDCVLNVVISHDRLTCDPSVTWPRPLDPPQTSSITCSNQLWTQSNLKISG